jgi:formylglycine-generating enzyme
MRQAILIAAVVGLGSVASAVDIETVPVGNAGNTGEWSGGSYGGNGPDRICGAVDYEYNIGKYEVTAGQYRDFLNKVARVDAYGLYNSDMWDHNYGCKIQRSGESGSYTYSVASDYENRPVNRVSWGDAARFANWMTNGQLTGVQDLNTTEDGAYYLNGATSDADLLAVISPDATQRTAWASGSKPYYLLASEDEWYKAAYHKNDGVTDNYYDYPTSNDSTPGYIDNSSNFSRAGDGSFTEGGIDPGNYATYDGDGQPHGSGSPYYRTEVGEHENSKSPYGTFDQGGNVWEWNEAIISGSYRGLRGGPFSLNEGALFAAYRNNYHLDVPTLEGSTIGFRVAQVPEPATMTLLSLGGLMLSMRKRNKGHKSRTGGREL